MGAESDQEIIQLVRAGGVHVTCTSWEHRAATWGRSCTFCWSMLIGIQCCMLVDHDAAHAGLVELITLCSTCHNTFHVPCDESAWHAGFCSQIGEEDAHAALLMPTIQECKAEDVFTQMQALEYLGECTLVTAAVSHQQCLNAHRSIERRLTRHRHCHADAQ